MKKPGWLTGYCTFAIVIGALGLFSAVVAVGSTFAAREVEKFTQKLQPVDPGGPGQEALDRMQEARYEVEDRFKPFIVTGAVANFVLSGLLIFAGTRAQKMNPAGRKLLLGVFLACAIYECAAIIPVMIMQIQLIPIQQDALTQDFDVGEAHGESPAPPKFVKSVVKLSMWGGIVVLVAFALAKATAYVCGFFYLRRPSIEALYEPQPTVAVAPSGEVTDILDFDHLDE